MHRKNLWRDLPRLAAGAALVAGVSGAWAQDGVQIYGRGNVGLDRYDATGATAGPAIHRTRLYDAISRLGFRGTEDLGGGYKAVFQMEAGVNFDTGTDRAQDGTANTNVGAFLRDTFVGLDTPAGRFTAGRQSVYWQNGAIIPASNFYINADVPFFTGVSTGRLPLLISRVNNSIMYTTPTLGGANASFSVSPTTSPGPGFVDSETVAPGAAHDARLHGLTVRWQGAPYAAQLDVAHKRTSSDAVAGLRPSGTGLKVMAGWRYMPGAQISVIGVRVALKDLAVPMAGFAARGDDLSQFGWGFAWEHMITPKIQLLASAGVLRDAKGCTSVVAGAAGRGCKDTGATSYMVAARYLFSKRTAVYASLNQVKNRANGTLDYTGMALNAVPNLSPGADPRIIALGIIHNF